MQSRQVFFTINTVLVFLLILSFWLVFLPAYEGMSIYEDIRNMVIIITIALVGAYVASSVVILGKV